MTDLKYPLQTYGVDGLITGHCKSIAAPPTTTRAIYLANLIMCS